MHRHTQSRNFTLKPWDLWRVWRAWFRHLKQTSAATCTCTYLSHTLEIQTEEGNARHMHHVNFAHKCATMRQKKTPSYTWYIACIYIQIATGSSSVFCGHTHSPFQYSYDIHTHLSSILTTYTPTFPVFLRSIHTVPPAATAHPNTGMYAKDCFATEMSQKGRVPKMSGTSKCDSWFDAMKYVLSASKFSRPSTCTRHAQRLAHFWGAPREPESWLSLFLNTGQRLDLHQSERFFLLFCV